MSSIDYLTEKLERILEKLGTCSDSIDTCTEDIKKGWELLEETPQPLKLETVDTVTKSQYPKNHSS